MTIDVVDDLAIGDAVPFRVRLSAGKALKGSIKTISLYAVGNSQPLVKRFDVTDAASGRFIDFVVPETTQHLMAVADLSDGSTRHCRALLKGCRDALPS